MSGIVVFISLPIECDGRLAAQVSLRLHALCALRRDALL